MWKSPFLFSLQVAYFEQNRFDIFEEEKTLFEFVKESTTLDDIELRNILALLNFRGDDINKKISILSKGEKVKLYFVSLLFRKTDVLLLDEITNFFRCSCDRSGREDIKEISWYTNYGESRYGIYR